VIKVCISIAYSSVVDCCVVHVWSLVVVVLGNYFRRYLVSFVGDLFLLLLAAALGGAFQFVLLLKCPEDDAFAAAVCPLFVCTCAGGLEHRVFSLWWLLRDYAVLAGAPFEFGGWVEITTLPSG
jgi:hypothetical protein